MVRRSLLKSLATLVTLPLLSARSNAAQPPPDFPSLTKSTSQWRALLDPARFEVLFEEATERPFTSELDKEKRPGTFVCAACFLPLFESSNKFNSGTGWPSFTQPIHGTHREQTRLQAAVAAHRVPLRPLHRTPRPRIRRRPAAARRTLVQQWSGADLRAEGRTAARAANLTPIGRQRRRQRFDIVRASPNVHPVAISAMSPGHQLCVAPMMEWTDRHCRQFHRVLSPNARLYTEMISTGALLHGPRERLLTFSAQQHPVALQLGGADPTDLAACARHGADAGFDEINLNVGCPSDRVQHARIGACLMRESTLVAECVAAMRAAVDVPITVKCRTGVDDDDGYDFLAQFVATVADAGCDVFIVHARKAILSGLTPAQNRTIPPLDWTRVARLKSDFPHLTLVVNGGIDASLRRSANSIASTA